MASLAPELPISPELVLVSPPELASLARALLPDARERPAEESTHRRSHGVAAFYACCFVNSVAPFVLALTQLR